MSHDTNHDTPARERPAVSLVHRDPVPVPPAFLGNRRSAFIALVVFVLWIGVLAAFDDGEVLLEIDEPIMRWVVERRTPALTDLFDGASLLGDNVVVFGSAVIVASITWRRCRYLAVAIVMSGAFRPLMEFVIKALIDRQRPDISPLRDFAGPSHPSGHPMAAAAFWGLIPAVVALHVRSRLAWRVSIVVAITVVVMVATSRVYLGGHYPSDVTASLAWASLYLMVVQGVFDRFHHERDCRHPQHATQAALA